MEKKNNKGIMVLLIIIIILSVLCVLFATNTINFKNKETNNNQSTENNKESQITEEKLKNIIENELIVLFKTSNPVTKKEDIENIDNQGKLLVALDILKNEYTTNSNDINTTIVSFSKTKLEDAFNSSVISNLEIKHEDFDVYKLIGTGNNYSRAIELTTFSKERSKYASLQVSKVINYEKKGNKYVISMNYLFPNTGTVIEDYYGSITDVENKTNSIIKAYDDNGNYINAQEYLDNNYNNIKDKLTTYNYTFEIINSKINLVDFSTN